jgi:exopolysaccharide biosynthesis polyprenyl glycosylphosphotransferase
VPTARRTPAQSEGDTDRAVEGRERNYRYALAIADASATLISVTLAVVLVGGGSLRAKGLLVVPLVVATAKVLGLYDRDELVVRKSTIDELPRLLNLAAVFALLAWLARHYIFEGDLATNSLLALWLLLATTLCVFRMIARRVAAHVSHVERCLLLGDVATYRRLSAKLAHSRHVELVDVVPLSRALRNAHALHDLSTAAGAHRVIIAADAAGTDARTLDLVRAAKASGLRVSLLPGILGAVGSSVVFDDLWGMPTLGVPRFGLSRSSNRVKRAFDLVAATLLTIALAPAMAISAVLIKLDGPGPVFFRQTRVGRDGRRFRIVKFRTMVEDADARKPQLSSLNQADGLFKIAEDPRITRVGKRLRHSCLDELPQLFNVLRGEMSLVGPRPLVINEDERITGLDRHRLDLTPGITGPWQILGSARIPLNEMVKLDYLYIANWSLWSDVKILLRTLPVVLERRGL